MARAKMWCDGLAGTDDETQVGLAVRGQRRRHADDDGIDVTDPGKIRRWYKTPALDHFAELFGGQVSNVGLTPLQHVDLGLIDIEADDAESGVGHRADQRQPDISQADHADHRVAAA